MRDAPVVAVAKTLNDLFKNTLSFLLIEPPVLLRLKVAVKTATANILHDQDHILARIDDLVQSNYVLISHLLHEFYLTFDRFSSVRLKQLRFLIDFHSYFFVGRAVKAYAHYRIGTLANLFAYHIVIERVLVTKDHAIIERIRSFCRLCLVRSRLNLLRIGLLLLGLISSLSIMLMLSLPLLYIRAFLERRRGRTTGRIICERRLLLYCLIIGNFSLLSSLLELASGH